MNVLVVYAHPNPDSFCHAVLERFTAGLAAGGHKSEIVDLYKIRFDPVHNTKDRPCWITPETPPHILEMMDLRKAVMDSCKNPLQRFLANRWLRGKDLPAIAAGIRQAMPKDIVEQQAKVAAADALVFIAPVFFVGFPAILKGWVERVFTLGFAFELSSDGWAGDVRGRIPLLKHEKALIISTTIFDENSYRETGIGDAMARLMDDWCFRFPGVKDVEHVYFYAMHDGDAEKRRRYLDRAYRLGRDFVAVSSPQPVEVSV